MSGTSSALIWMDHQAAVEGITYTVLVVEVLAGEKSDLVCALVIALTYFTGHGIGEG